MDEARAHFDPEELAAVLARYDIGRIDRTQDFPRGSHESAKMLIHTDRGRFLLKRRPRGKDDPQRVAFAHELQNYLAARSFPLPHLIGTRDDHASMLRFNDAVYELFEFIPGEGYDPTPAAATESGRMLALFHRLVRDMPLRYEPPTGHYHDSDRVRALLAQIAETLPDLAGAPSAANQPDAVRETVEQLTEAYAQAGASARTEGMDAWDVQIVHCDWHPGNVLFHEHRVVAVLDFDSARLQPPVTDLANGGLQHSMRTGDRNPDSWPDDCHEDRLLAFIAGYDAVGRVSVAELRALPALMIEALIGEAVGPIAASGHFARLDGFAFLRTVVRKARWLDRHARRLADAAAQSA